MASPRRRLSTSLATVLVLAGAGGLAWVGAEAAATFLEDRAAAEVGLALRVAGHDWVQVRTDGLQVRLAGTAPSEVERFRALTEAATAVDASRVRDQMTVASIEAMTPPEFKIELLRNDQGLSLIGLVPAATDRETILRALRPATGDGQITDLLESADHAVPPGWDAALRFGLQAAAMAAQSKISIAPAQVHVAALAQDGADKDRLEAALRGAAPQGVEVATDITAPRPVVSPFVLRFAIGPDGAGLEACAADDDAARQRIVQAAQAAGMQTLPDCVLGLGAPSPDWGDAAVAAIEAVTMLGQGQITLSDTGVNLTAPETVERGRFDQVVGQLQQALPSVFELDAQLEQPQPQAVPIEFLASLEASGSLTMNGRIADAQMREAVDSFARSRFDVAQSGLRTDASVPAGWTVRVIAGLEAIDALHVGTVEVTPGLVKLSGMSGDPQAADVAAALLTERLGPGAQYQLGIGYDRRLDEALALPDGEDCAAGLNLIMSESEIGFEPSRSTVAGDPENTLTALSEAMVECAVFQMEASGHTDSQGSEQFNAELSRSRAQAIVTAMQEAGIDVSNMSSRGYGESQPIAPNDTEEGREANRRIEFRLLSPRPVRADAPRAPAPVRGVTGEVVVSEPLPALPAAVVAPAPVAPPMPDRMQGPRLPAMQGPMPEPAGAALPPMQGPQLPQPPEGPAMVPMTVGAAEEFQTVDEREENLRVPVLTPDETTPRPGLRPDSVAGRADPQDGTSDE